MRGSPRFQIGEAPGGRAEGEIEKDQGEPLGGDGHRLREPAQWAAMGSLGLLLRKEEGLPRCLWQQRPPPARSSLPPSSVVLSLPLRFLQVPDPRALAPPPPARAPRPRLSLRHHRRRRHGQRLRLPDRPQRDLWCDLRGLRGFQRVRRLPSLPSLAPLVLTRTCLPSQRLRGS